MPVLDHAAVFEEHRPFLFGLAYRMLGSAMDAEDLVQESFLNFRKSDPAVLREPRAFLSTILTRRVLDFMKSARVRREEYVGQWLPEPLVEEESAGPAGAFERTESVSTAFLLMLETLSPVERAVYLLRDVFDFDYGEIAPIVERSSETCRRIASRARQRLQAEKDAAPRFPVSPDNQERLLDRFLRACRGDNLEELIGVLAADARIYSDGGGKVTSAINIIFGSVNSGRFILGVLKKAPARFPLKIKVAGQPALALFSLEGKLDSVTTFSFNGDRLEKLYVVRNPDKLERLARTVRPGWWRIRWYRLLSGWRRVRT